MRDSLHTVLYALVLGVVCASLLTAASERLKPYQEDNRQAERVRNILGVLDVPFDAKAPWELLEKVYLRAVDVTGTDDDAIYKRLGPDGKTVLSVAVPLSGRGRNGPIKGFLALEPDMRTIRGITFYRHEETPGLGGEIDAPDWKKKFVGKRIDGEGGIRIITRGKAVGPHEVDGITSATMTCRKVEALLNAKIEQLRKEGGDG